MTLISARSMFFYKRVMPAVFFAIPLFFIAIGISVAVRNNAPFFVIPFLLFGSIWGIAVYFILKLLVFDLMDEVWDCGDALLIKNRGEEERIPFADFMNVSYTKFANPPRITLTLRRESRFGREISFTFKPRLYSFKTPELVANLIVRVDAARGGRLEAGGDSDQR